MLQVHTMASLVSEDPTVFKSHIWVDSRTEENEDIWSSGFSQTYVQSSLAPACASVVTPSTTLTQSASPPVGFAAFSPKQLGVPTTNLFGGFTSAASSYQFGAGPSVSTTALVN